MTKRASSLPRLGQDRRQNDHAAASDQLSGIVGIILAAGTPEAGTPEAGTERDKVSFIPIGSAVDRYYYVP